MVAIPDHCIGHLYIAGSTCRSTLLVADLGSNVVACELPPLGANGVAVNDKTGYMGVRPCHKLLLTSDIVIDKTPCLSGSCDSARQLV